MRPQWIILALWLKSFIFMASTWPLLALKSAKKTRIYHLLLYMRDGTAHWEKWQKGMAWPKQIWYVRFGRTFLLVAKSKNVMKSLKFSCETFLLNSRKAWLRQAKQICWQTDFLKNGQICGQTEIFVNRTNLRTDRQTKSTTEFII